MSEHDWLGLGGKTAVVTGAGGGIGRAIAGSLVAAGAKVALLDLKAEAAEAAANEIGGTTVAIGCDVTSDGDVAQAHKRLLEALGPADVLVNNAAFLAPGPLESVPLADWERMLQVNLTGYLRCAQAFGADMRKRGDGALVHIASIAATQPQPFSGSYSPGKAGVEMLSRQLAYEWGPMGVRSNCVSPGLVRTPMSEAFYDPETKARREAVVPMRRIGTTRDIADAVTFLASARATYISGQNITVDGGLSQIIMGTVPRPGFGNA